MRGEPYGVRRRLRPAVDGDGEPPGAGLEEVLRDARPLGVREQDPLPRRAEGEQAVEAGAGEEVDVRADSVLVDAGAAVRERRECCGERSPDQQLNDPVTLTGGLSKREAPVSVPRLRPSARVTFSVSPRTR